MISWGFKEDINEENIIFLNFIFTFFFYLPGKGVKIYSSSISYGVMIKNGFLYTVLEDSNDDRKLVKYKVSLPFPNPGA
jgi:hypothetical protein